jgi:tetratricopeptide (TPR) repeat protein
MEKITLKEFISALKARLEKYSHEELKEILLAQGIAMSPQERLQFLEGFVLPEKKERKPKGGKEKDEDADLLLSEIEAFEKRVDKYEFTTGWGWDDEYGAERAWGDDSWVSEVDGLFDRIHEFYEAGNYEIARKAFESLLEIYRGGMEEAKFSGYDQDEMIETDIEEAALKYLRCVYLTEPTSERPQAIWKAMSKISFGAEDVNIHGLINVSTEELPQLEEFGRQWREFLKKQKVSSLSTHLLKEAVRLFQGVKGLENLAMEKGEKIPSAFVEWLDALKKENKHEETIRAASLGLEKLPNRLLIRAKIADYLHAAAVKLKRKDLISRALKEALFANPSLERLLDLLDNTPNREERNKTLQEALDRFAVIQERKGKDRYWDSNRLPDFFEAEVPDNLVLQACLLKGDYEKAGGELEKAKPLGWSSGENPGVLGVAFFLFAKWNQGKKLGANLAELWKEATDPRPFSYLDYYGGSDEEEGSQEPRKPRNAEARFRTCLEGVLKEIPFREDEKEEYFHRAEKMALRRIDAIVGNQHRKSYWKAAQLLLGVAEVYWSNGESAKGQKIVDQIRDKYRHHSAFRSELRTRAKKGGTFSV